MIKQPAPLRLAVLISGSGTNLQAIIDAIRAGRLQAEIALVISNESDALGLERARRAGIATRVLDHRSYPSRLAYDEALRKLLSDGEEVDLVVLAGFMRVLSRPLVEHFAGRIMNIHPSLLPRYPGLDTHARALADGAREHGATVHFVTPELDAGPVIIQRRVPVLPDDTPQSLAERVHAAEHRIYPTAVGWFADGRLSIVDGNVLLDGERRPEQGIVPPGPASGASTNSIRTPPVPRRARPSIRSGSSARRRAR